MKNRDNPLYISKACPKSFWNEYRIYNDRIELKSWLLLRTFLITYNDLVTINVYEPPVIKTRLWALKLDCADLNQHVGIERKSGWFKHLRFTPRNPQEFVLEVKKYSNL